MKAIWVRPRKDAQDAIDTLRFGLGLRSEPPEMERFNYKEKAEYWALVWGTLVMSVTGVVLWSAPFWSAQILDVSRAIHSYEAILASTCGSCHPADPAVFATLKVHSGLETERPRLLWARLLDIPWI